jgi:hypothetical protein
MYHQNTFNMNTYTRRQLSKLAADILETNENRQITNRYLAALRTLDIPTLQFFESMGEDARHRIMNAHEYLHAQKFGISEIKFCRSGWFDYEWNKIEEIDFHHGKDKISTNKITLACGANNKWTYGLSLTFGSYEGSGYYPSVFCKPYNSREECLQAATTDAIAKFEQKICSPDRKPKCIEQMKNILQQIVDLKYKSQHVQLGLF